jgi:hypothetical protein
MFLFVALKEAHRVPLSQSMSTLRYGAMKRLQFDRKKLCMSSVAGLLGYTPDISPGCCSMVWDTHFSKLVCDRATCYFYKQVSCQRTRRAHKTPTTGNRETTLRSEQISVRLNFRGCQLIDELPIRHPDDDDLLSRPASTNVIPWNRSFIHGSCG